MRFRDRRRSWIAALLALACAATPAVAQDTGTIRGTVTATAGGPLAGARVQVVGSDRAGVSIRALDENGADCVACRRTIGVDD